MCNRVSGEAARLTSKRSAYCTGLNNLQSDAITTKLQLQCSKSLNWAVIPKNAVSQSAQNGTQQHRHYCQRIQISAPSRVITFAAIMAASYAFNSCTIIIIIFITRLAFPALKAVKAASSDRHNSSHFPWPYPTASWPQAVNLEISVIRQILWRRRTPLGKAYEIQNTVTALIH